MPASPNDADAAKRELIAGLLRAGCEIRIRVTGISMLPAIWPGDVITVVPTAWNALQADDIAVFQREGRIFAHRVVARSSDGLITRGDSHACADAPVPGEGVLGRVSEVESGGTHRSPRSHARAVRMLFRWPAFRRITLVSRRTWMRLNAA